MDRVSRLHYLLHVYTIGAATPAERSELLAAVRLPGNATLVKDLLGEEMDRMEMPEQEMEGLLPNEKAEQVLANIFAHPSTGTVTPMIHPRRTIRKWSTRAAAILLFLAAGIGGYKLATQSHQNTVAQAKSTPPKDIQPGTSKAILTLANGSTILLDSAQSGPLTRQGGASIVKLDSGKLAYTTKQRSQNEVLYNKLETPRGGQYQLTLPDGSAVWLNAASSIRYPTTFAGPTREVEITGEAYFEIAKNTAMPFIVKAGQTQTTVLGTSFNINAYEDENKVITTLLEGAVKFGHRQESQAANRQAANEQVANEQVANKQGPNKEDEKLLHPGEQGALQETTQVVTVQQADTYQAIAWKNGQFDFDNKTLAVILRQISRWYDVDISNPSVNDATKFGGGISRKLNLSHVLHLLEKNGVHTRLEGHKIIVLP